MRMRRPRIRAGCCLSGQVLVYTVLVMTVTISLIAALIQAAVYSGARAEADMACRLASEAGLSGYHEGLLETYGIFALKDDGHLEKKVERMIRGNLQENDQVSLDGVRFDRLVSMTDAGGMAIREEVTAYMKDGALSEAVTAALENTEMYRKAEATGEVMQQLQETQEAAMETEETQLELLPLIEGIRAGGGSIQRVNGRPVGTGEACVKTAVGSGISQGAVGVESGPVFEAVISLPDGYVSIPEMAGRMRQALFEENGAGSEFDAGRTDAAAFGLARQRACQAVDGSIRAAGKALQVIKEEDSRYSSFLEKAAQAGQLLTQSESLMDPETYSAAQQTLQDTKDAADTRGLIDTARAEAALRTRLSQLKRASDTLEEMRLPEDAASSEKWKKSAETLESICREFDNSDLVFDYSGVDFTQKGSGTERLHKILNVLGGHQTELILNGREVSSAKIDTAGRAGETALASGPEGAGERTSRIMDEALYNEYLFLYFDSYADTLKGKSAKPQTELAYPLEYILCGKSSDAENLNEVTARLMLIRQGMNFTCLMLSPSKREEAMSLASAMTGFTGSLPAVKTAQLLVLTAWSYAEALTDLRVLFEGKKISAVKTEAGWNTSLEQLLTLDFPEGREDPGGISYDEYLRILLLSCPLIPKYFRTMGAMESGMIRAGEADFRMSGYLFSFEGEAQFVWKPTGKTFTCPVSYSYE
jgi:hypothetical protein